MQKWRTQNQPLTVQNFLDDSKRKESNADLSKEDFDVHLIESNDSVESSSIGQVSDYLSHADDPDVDFTSHMRSIGQHYGGDVLTGAC